MRTRLVVGIVLLLALGCLPGLAAAQAAPMILALGNTGFLDPKSIQAATGAEVKTDLDKFQLKDFSVVVLANIAFPSLPGSVQQALVQYVTDGGALLITGGSQSFGSGGYEAVASIIPFQIRSGSDWRTTPFRPPVPSQPAHPILAGVNFITVGNLNDMNPRSDATEILRAAGGGSAAHCRTVCSTSVVGGRTVQNCQQVCPPGVLPAPSVVTPEGSAGGSYSFPLTAEIGAGAGWVIGIAFDLNEFAGMPDRDLFVRNTVTYLFNLSRMR